MIIGTKKRVVHRKIDVPLLFFFFATFAIEDLKLYSLPLYDFEKYVKLFSCSK